METSDKIISYGRLSDYHNTFIKPIIPLAKNSFQKTGDSIDGKILLASSENHGETVPELENEQLFFLQQNILRPSPQAESHSQQVFWLTYWSASAPMPVLPSQFLSDQSYNSNLNAFMLPEYGDEIAQDSHLFPF